MAKGGPEEGPQPERGYFMPRVEKPFNAEDTQPSKAVGEIRQPIKAVRAEPVEREPTPEPEKKPTDTKNPSFGFGSLILLILLIWGSELLGTTLPGPLDDLLYQAIAALFFGLIQHLRTLLYKK